MESSRVPIEDNGSRQDRQLSHANSASQIDGESRAGDLLYIKEFLKEIESIEQINQRSDKYIVEKSQETY